MFYLRGKMEKLGRGLSLIKERFTGLGLQTPEWSTQSGYTTLVLFGIPKPIEINERMYLFLGQLVRDSKFRCEDYMDYFKGNIKEKTARADLQKLVDGGWLSRIGDGPTTSYSRTKKNCRILPDRPYWPIIFFEQSSIKQYCSLLSLPDIAGYKPLFRLPSITSYLK